MLLAAASMLLAAAALPEDAPQGSLLWHHYSSYDARDSVLLLADGDDSLQQPVGDFVHAMNGDFGSSPFDIVFMAIDPVQDEWDIYRWDVRTGNVQNLTVASGFRNEDPKFMPDGRHIVMKRGKWDAVSGEMRYNLAEMDLYSGEITMLTDDTMEESMPYPSPDGSLIYYAGSEQGRSGIYALQCSTGQSMPVFMQPNVYAYYPICFGQTLYFTRWQSAENQNDCLTAWRNGTEIPLSCNDAAWNCSDACPVSEDMLIFSSTEHGDYDLYLSDGAQTYALSTCHTDLNELGAAFYSEEKKKAYLQSLLQTLLSEETPAAEYDIDHDGVVSAVDLTLLKRGLLS